MAVTPSPNRCIFLYFFAYRTVASSTLTVCRGCYCWSGSIPVMFGFGDFQKHGEDGNFKMTNKCGGCLGIAGAWNGSAMYTKKDQSGAPGSAEMER